MNNKLLVSVFVPAIELEYDMFIPINKTVGTVKKMITNSLIDLTYGIYTPNNKLELYIKEDGRLLNDNVYIKEANINNGERIILF